MTSERQEAKHALRSSQNEARAFTYVYIIQSINFPDKRYTGISSDLKRRLYDHNRGQSPHTAPY